MDKVRVDMAMVRTSRHEATQSLLGDTIGITDEQWNQPSRLPGWTRAHVATHLARNADAFVRIMEQLRGHKPTRLYASETDRREEIERGSERTALELQVDLDASAGRLHTHLPELMKLPPDRLVHLTPTLTQRLERLPIARLNEVVLHHIDLDVGFSYHNIENHVASWLLSFNADRIGRNSAYPAIRIVADSGLTVVIGGPGHPGLVHGADNFLLCWLTGRLPEGDAGAKMPLLPCL